MSVFVTLLLVLFMFYSANVIFYLLSLLILSCILISFLFSLNILSGLVSLMLLLVYAGAIIILIGYICAVTPNPVFSSNFTFLNTSVFFLILSYFSSIFFSLPSYNLDILFVSNYFYNTQGALVFSTVVFMLFLTLLIVTSQFLLPSGPFRAVS